MPDFQVVIVGAGLVGSLAAISFARQGYHVSLYENRSDPRLSSNAVGRSINLAVSARGLGAIKSIDPALCDRIIQDSIPMKGRMIHIDGKQQSQIYGLFGECINSIDRTKLNLDLLDEAEKHEHVTLYFDHKLVLANLSKKTWTFEHGTKEGVKETRGVHADLTVGCDGAYSTVRQAMMKAQRMDFEQQYIRHAYLELSILPSDQGEWQLDPHHLHIWPRQEFMLIALPNPDKSFTSTLFAPYQVFDSLQDDSSRIDFFEAQFPDALHMMGKERLLDMWQRNPVAPLIQVTCAPCHFEDSVILLGDATHAMVPFYGQGMNCGFEDIRVLNAMLKKHNISPNSTKDMQKALEAYSTNRHADLQAILKLAMGNYVEMRSSVTSRLYLLKKQIDGVLGIMFKERWVPMYSMVSFRDDIRYSEVVERQRRQDSIIHSLMIGIIGVSSLSLATLILRLSRLQSWRSATRSLLQSILNHI